MKFRPVSRICLALVVSATLSATALGGAESPVQPLEPVYFQQAKIEGFWKAQFKRLTEKWIPHCIRQMEEGGRGQELLNLVHTAKALKGEPHGKFTGAPWSDAYVYNTVESICLALAIDSAGDPELAKAQAFLRKKLEEWIPIILAAQMEDGYIHSFHIVNQRPRYTRNGDHEFYVQGYFLEMGVAHYLVTGGKDRRLFDAARKCADHLCATFGPAPKRVWVHGHPGMEIALCRFARLVNQVEGAGKGDKYSDLAKFLYDTRHTDERHRSAYQQSHLPVIDQAEAVGHAVRACYFYAGMADIALLKNDAAFRTAVDRIWDSAVNRKMYITGGVGSTHQGEAFGSDYDLPNESAYCESCAGCGLSFWADRMNRLHQHARAVDIQERVLYNNILGAIELSGENFFYQNPLGSDKKRYPWHGCPCCVGNIPRALLAIKDSMYALNPARDTLVVNHYVAGAGRIANVAGTSLDIEQRTQYPWQGEVRFILTPRQPARFTLKVRIPDRGDSALYQPSPSLEGQYTIRVNGEAQSVAPVNGYISLERTWKAGDQVDLALPMDIQRMRADARVKAVAGRVALQRGPLVYGLEDADHGDQSRAVVLKPDTVLRAVWMPDLLEGVVAIASEDQRLLAIPNFVRLNRGGWSQVWIPEKPELAEPYLEPTLASTATVTTSFQTDEGRFSLRAIHDRKEPKASDEKGTPLFHWWPHQGTREWVQYEFKKPAKINAVEVYWYDDRAWGNCRVPESWRVLYREGGEWKPVQGASAAGVEIDKYNRVTFMPMTTDALRLEVQLQPNFGAGILEWKVEQP